ncbi:hypothetical protein JCM21738_1658 [Mesobacillus boroniphilus JCM 21738]|uniref:Uncharacterized protein n=1 Tax=Mesobacillus boroniphilus JCM 21738 TaxID=1294265 RepID=W4RLD1_9BACI|nr:hypothetical protein JCM21738_1658 [Mesobacillus boroniphilus JCM 21738]
MRITIQVFLIQLQRLAPRVACLVSPPRNSETSTPPSEAKSASDGGVSSFCVSWQSAILFDFGPPNEVKERLHWSALQRLSGLTKALALFLFIKMKQAIETGYNTILQLKFKSADSTNFLTKISSLYSLWRKTKNSIMERIKVELICRSAFLRMRIFQIENSSHFCGKKQSIRRFLKA